VAAGSKQALGGATIASIARLQHGEFRQVERAAVNCRVVHDSGTIAPGAEVPQVAAERRTTRVLINSDGTLVHLGLFTDSSRARGRLRTPF
jgi:hypothetical protein